MKPNTHPLLRLLIIFQKSNQCFLKCTWRSTPLPHSNWYHCASHFNETAVVTFRTINMNQRQNFNCKLFSKVWLISSTQTENSKILFSLMIKGGEGNEWHLKIFRLEARETRRLSNCIRKNIAFIYSSFTFWCQTTKKHV